MTTAAIQFVKATEKPESHVVLRLKNEENIEGDGGGGGGRVRAEMRVVILEPLCSTAYD
jgi:hypothetical protein